MTNEQLLEQIQALKELISIQKQTIEALKAQSPKIEYRYTYTPYYTKPYIYQPYVYGSGGSAGVAGTGYTITTNSQAGANQNLSVVNNK